MVSMLDENAEDSNERVDTAHEPCIELGWWPYVMSETDWRYVRKISSKSARWTD